MSNPADRTRMIARAAGPYFLIMGAVLAVRGADLALIFPAFMQDGPLALVTGAFTLIVGLAVLAAHHHWTSPAAVAISLTGALAALKGAMLMLAPDVGAGLSAAFLRAPLFPAASGLLLALLGAWLTWVGWRRANIA
jgi:hypothetical protein